MGDPMLWHWDPLLMDGAEVSSTELSAAGLQGTWPTQGEAESWLGESYPDLADLGVDSVSLYEGDRLVYGPMSLAPPA